MRRLKNIHSEIEDVIEEWEPEIRVMRESKKKERLEILCQRLEDARCRLGIYIQGGYRAKKKKTRHSTRKNRKN